MVSTERKGVYIDPGTTTLEVIRKDDKHGPEETLASYELRYLADTHEVALLRWDPETEEHEAVYSEAVG